jgi:large-conductance mechanosensitive channel
MKKNMGTLDRIIRIAVAVIIGVLYFTGVISGLTAIVLMVIAAVFILTSFVGFCPLYALIGINSSGKGKERTDAAA